MATRNERGIGTVGGGIIGLAIAAIVVEGNPKIAPKNKWKYYIGGCALGAGTGFVAAEILGTPNDTVNYSLFNKGEHVYEGITFEDRLPVRIKEHIKSGKVFDQYHASNPRPRVDAAKIEIKNIKRANPPLNIQHTN